MANADDVLQAVGALGRAFRDLNAEGGFDQAQSSFLRGRRLALGAARQRFDEAFGDGVEQPEFAAIVDAAQAATEAAATLAPEDGAVNAFGKQVTDIVARLDKAIAKPAATIATIRRGLGARAALSVMGVKVTASKPPKPKPTRED